MLPPLTPLVRFRLSLVAAGSGAGALLCLGVGGLLLAGGDAVGGRVATIAAGGLAILWAIAITGSAVCSTFTAVQSALPPSE